jgi:predicted RNA polymerase sigma factor
VEQFRYVVEKFPEVSSIERRFGELLERAGRTAEAAAAFDKANGLRGQ